MNLREWLKESSSKLNHQECIYLARVTLGQEMLEMEADLKPIAVLILKQALNMRLDGFPLAKIIQSKDFYEHSFVTTEFTLDPRPETEYLLEIIDFKPRSILELGVGTGCILFSILKMFPKAKGVGIDLSFEALEVAKRNMKLLALEKRVQLKQGNWANDEEESFDLIISNPPYVSNEAKLEKELAFEPKLALFGDVSTYQDLINSLKNVKFKELILEVPENLLEEVKKMTLEIGLQVEAFQIYDTKIFALRGKVEEFC